MPRSAADREADELLKPVFKAFKRQAADAIREAQAEIANILKVDYDAHPDTRPEGLPTPRLQLRWEGVAGGMYQRVCHYEMVFALNEHDCRNDPKTGFAVVQLGRTLQGGSEPDWSTDLGRRTPYRDGAHAKWDAKQFGDWPIYVIAPDGRSAPLDDSRPKFD